MDGDRMNVDEAYAFCRAITHKHGANFSVGFRFLPAVKRRAVYAAYAYCRFADDIADEDVLLSEATDLSASGYGEPGVILSEAKDPLIALEEGGPSPSVRLRMTGGEDAGVILSEAKDLPACGHGEGPSPSARLRMTRLDAWQRELDACYDGHPTHPITIALADALRHFAIPKSAFVALIDGCRQDMVKTRYETFDELLAYCDLVATSISDISLSIFGYRTDAALRHGRSLATALQLTNVTRDVGDDLTRDRIYIPAVELREFGVSERELVERAENERVRRLIEFQIARAEGYFRDAEPLLRELAFDARFPTLLMGGVYATVLARLRKDPFAAIRERLSLSPLQKLRVVGARVLRPHFL
jgi:15-cis-phytoene synthase